MTTVAAEGRIEKPGAIPELSGRKPQLAGNGAANVTGMRDNSAPKTDGLMEAIVSRGNMMAAYERGKLGTLTSFCQITIDSIR